MELACEVQKYDWGKKGLQSKVAALYINAYPEFTVDENLPYAELWMGTHVNGQSVVKQTGETLEHFISQHPECLGEETAKLFNNKLPFLFKVLSIDKALSIQAHPAKKHAEELHCKYPNIYKDPNHKPELAIALTPFEALCGFRPIAEIRKFIQEIPEIGRLIDRQDIDDVEFLKQSFRSVLTSKKDVIANAIDSIIKRHKNLDKTKRTIFLADLVERLNEQFPNDCGVLMVYFLNYIQLNPSEALYLGPNEPHAYLSGDCVECMACSDNVVRAGLTPKLIDVETLCLMLNYEGVAPCAKLFNPIEEECFSKIYKPPVHDFAVAEIRIPASVKQYKPLRRKSASIVMVISGNGKYSGGELKPGKILFLPANDSLNITEIIEEILMYQALANVF